MSSLSIESTAYHVPSPISAEIAQPGQGAGVRRPSEVFCVDVADTEPEITDPLLGRQKRQGALTLAAPDGRLPMPVERDGSTRRVLAKVPKAITPVVRDSTQDARA